MSIGNRAPRGAAAVAFFAAVAASAPVTQAAGVFTHLPFAGDADSGISGANTYSHAIDFAAPAGAIVVNGLRFNDDDDLITGRASWSLIGVPNGLDGASTNNLVGEIAKVVSAFRFGATDAGGQGTFILKGLRPGAQYVTTFYNRGWDPSPRPISLTTSDGGAIDFNQDFYGQGNGNKLTYTFTAAANTLQFNFLPTAGASHHFYGMTNQLVAGSPFVVRPVTGDADSGVLPTGTYTHAVDVNGVGATVNGINFVGGGTAGDGGFGKTYAITGASTQFAGDDTAVTGGLGSMLANFIYDGQQNGQASLTLDGLTPGESYELTLFSSSFGNPNGRVLTFSHADGSIVFDANFTGDNQGNALSYLYTATGTSETFNFDPHIITDTLHIYAFANRVSPVPEPGAVSLLAAAGAMLLRRRR